MRGFETETSNFAPNGCLRVSTNVCKKPEESDILPYPALSGIQNSEPEEPDHEMGQTRPALTRNSDISGILG